MVDENQKGTDQKEETPVTEDQKTEELPEPVTDNPQLLAMANRINGLADSMDSAIEEITKALQANSEAIVSIRQQTAEVLQQVPTLINNQVEGKLSANLQTIISQVNAQFEEKLKATLGAGNGNGNGAAGQLSLGGLAQLAPQIIEVINAWKQPSSEQAMAGQMANIFKWHQLLSKLEKGGLNAETITESIAETFAPGAPEEPAAPQS